jgi:hypothetical protein
MHGAGLFQESQDNKIWSQDSQDKQQLKQLIYINPERTILKQNKRFTNQVHLQRSRTFHG